MSDIRSRLQAIRAFSFPASIIPVFIGGALAWQQSRAAAWHLYPVVILSAVLLHAATNVISEYFDFRKGVDRKETFGSSRVLVDKLLTPEEVLAEGYLLLAAAFILGLILVYARGMPMLALGLTGILGGYFYSAGPSGYKYHGLGDLAVFLLMGPLMVAGTYFALTGEYNYRVTLISLPIGCLVTAILSANNLRDLRGDRLAGVTTLENALGFRKARLIYLFLTASAFAGVIWMVLSGILPAWSLLVLLGLPPGVRNLITLARCREGSPRQIARLDAETAKLHLLFGALLGLSLILARAAK